MTTTEIEERFGRFLVELGFADLAAQEHADDIAFDRHADGDWQEWSSARRAIGREQLVYKWVGIDVGAIDGLVGPQTRYAREAYIHLLEHGTLPDWRDQEADTPARPNEPSVWPTTSQRLEFYGHPDEVRRVMVRVPCPWTLRLAWDLRSTRSFVWAHPKISEDIGEVFELVWQTYGEQEIARLRLDRFGGDFNPRTMRGGTKWSDHAFAVAYDWDPERNQLRWGADRAALAHPVYEEWWRAWEDYGFRSLGRERGYDFMHVAAVRY